MKITVFAAALLFSAQLAPGIVIQLDYTFDAANGNFFGTNTVARAAVEAAAANLNAAILPTLGAINTDTFTGINGSTTAVIEWDLSFSNPATNAPVQSEVFTPIPSDTLTFYVAMASLSGNTLGRSGPAAAAVQFSGNGFPAEWDTALDNAEGASNAVMSRGGGPVMGSLSGQVPLGSAPGNYSVRFGALGGVLSLDNDSDNNGVGDTAAALENYWHFNHTTAVTAGKNDFYSVALHEMIHALGLGASDTWDSLYNDTTWFGLNARALNGGSGVGLVDTDEAHIAEGLMSRRLTDGLMQEVVMDPSIVVGTRKFLTEMDLAFLRDLGYATIPEPAAATTLIIGASLGATRRRRRSRI
jgi:hypothetical protein